ncbi:MAG: pyruvate:ferredoxin (flavodoxin) oxidoreductase [Flavobacteriales bacterium]|nr:pyruvate:ferredoxin (flavodoxin) oxidoreductase [Flavobacteriia bacterium]NCP05847.1 pyruvate:ferredoxin (flavodoxin) oxidoreductase [Flavobacteriales bacterium]PIV93198.1 MAG: pyruvate:ferredoxin (flavodoxin) oxidoreductase [Flavobacteriaceae bacterium CG17_big_fil_post_rev_8_21_14_2_50_33_15]PIY12489.1 MAG: pyruvate:ferredoxin (flavodoxin) oxidoreductase [Flavobacteriaceae bacterium CG_4_10_14_3_um_filter_33_47]PJB19755.1 MAG: pyruvate:ferredoxin (flavodoxin) oxidoreductase [Flavobacteriac
MEKGFEKLICDANEAVARVAHKTNEVCAIYPITPASPMGEHVDVYSSKGQKNIWNNIPRIVEMQSEGGAAGAVHGALQAGALTTTFTASQGLLLMIPNMYKIAGELLPTVIHVAARTIATHALSIFGDHSDVMAARQTGFAMLFGGSVQEAQDFALISQVATLKSRVPFLNIFDGFRTSHEISKIDAIPDSIIKAMMPEDKIMDHKKRSLDPDHPVIKGTSQNPDVFFQAREASNTFYQQVPEIVQNTMDEFYAHTGRRYNLFDYIGHPEAERIIIIMGSGEGAVKETVNEMVERGEKVGALLVRLYRPFSIENFIEFLPKTVKKIAVLDRTKEPGSIGEPLYLDIISALTESDVEMPQVVGGRYGLSSKEFNPRMVKGIYDELLKAKPKNHFTVGIYDDVTHTNLEIDDYFTVKRSTINCMFYGLGSDGTVGANKNSIKIIGDTTDNYVQGYFVYDSKKAGAQTISHLRFGPEPIHSTYLIDKADFIASHQFNFIEKYNMLSDLKLGGTFLLNSPYSKEEIWDQLPKKLQKEIIEKEAEFYIIDASRVAQEANLGKRANTILQTCFFAISGILPKDEAIQKIKDAIVKSYSHKGEKIVKMNFNAVDKSLENLQKVDYPKVSSSEKELLSAMTNAPDGFVKDVLEKILAGAGDELPVSAFPVDGTFPTGTTQYEKRGIADFIPIWDDANLCTQCNKCVAICPHAAIRSKVVSNDMLVNSPSSLKAVPAKGRPFDTETESYVLQVSPEDCTGCDLCVAVCPAVSKEIDDFKSINMRKKLDYKEEENNNWDYFVKLPYYDRSELQITNVKGSQFLEPLFEFSGACSGCGETPYIKLLTQLYGDSILVANATGCSSIYGGNLPTTPYKTNEFGRGPAWANSLFEDNAEFGLGMRLALTKKQEIAVDLLKSLEFLVGSEIVESILSNPEVTETEKAKKIADIEDLKKTLKVLDNNDDAIKLSNLTEYLRKKAVWIIGGDGWAYDIGYGGVDHVLASGEDINILILDTEVYSNTGGQTSKATPLGASAKFSVSGKRTSKKSLALQAVSYQNVYVAQVAIGAKDLQTLKAIEEAAAYPGPSVIIAYSHCGEHGYDLKHGAEQQEKAVDSGYWPLFRFDPQQEKGKKFRLDSKKPTIPLSDFMYNETRFTRVVKDDAELGKSLLNQAQEEVNSKWERLEIYRDM